MTQPPSRIEPIAVTARTATTAVGPGTGPLLAALRTGRGGLRPCAFDAYPGTRHVLPTWIGEIDGLDAWPVPDALAAFECRNNRILELALAQDGFADAVARARARHGAARVAVVMGTSTAGPLQGEHAYARRDGEARLPADFRYMETLNAASTARYVSARLGLEGPAWCVSTACSSGAKAFAAGERMLRVGLVDAVVVGGCDSLCGTTLHGFDALQLLSDSPCRPFDASRSGISIGEGAGLALLERGGPDTAARTLVRLVGYGESSDAHHMSAPHPDGAGAERAMRDALARAGLVAGDVAYLNLHGTATPSNDAAEGRAVRAVFGDRAFASSTKGWTGHLLGAAGAVEAVIGMLAIEHGFAPGTLNLRDPDPACAGAVLADAVERPVPVAMSNSFGFGGSNCSLAFAAAAR